MSGFGGTSEIMLAMERREVDALENSWNSVVRTKREWIENKKINVLIQAVLERSKELPDTPTLVEMGETPEGKAALAFYTSSAAVSRSLIGTPGIPADRLKALRDGVPGGDARPGVPDRDQEVAVGIRSGAGRIPGRSRQEDRGDAAGHRAAHRGGAEGEVALSVDRA